MSSHKQPVLALDVLIEKLVHGGQGIGALPDGRKVFVWNALPQEIVDIELTKSKKDFAEGFAIAIKQASPMRVLSLDRQDINLSVMPWSIMDEAYEYQQKSLILNETFAREGIVTQRVEVYKANKTAQTGYRNKIEFSFWGDDDGLHFAHYIRATHQKAKLSHPYTELIPLDMADRARAILTELRSKNIRASELKSLILRRAGVAGQGKVVAALFVKSKDFIRLSTPDVAVVYSNPKSPASVRTELLYTNGDITLSEQVLSRDIMYDVFSFFQVNVPVFENAVTDIKGSLDVSDMSIVDLYSGVGSIGISVGAHLLVESDEINAGFAKKNASPGTKVLCSPSERALDLLSSEQVVIVDPPRAGLHADLRQRLLTVRPKKIIYLSCNPATQARDVAELSSAYTITTIKAYNFFPRTPHIESLVVLELK